MSANQHKWVVTLPDGRELTPLLSETRRKQIQYKMTEVIQNELRAKGNISSLPINLSYYIEVMLRTLEMTNNLEPGKELIETTWKIKQ